jgi:hypothetical protein
MVSEPGQRRVRDREVETLRNLYALAHFLATETFDADVDPVLELDIRGRGSRTIDLRGTDTAEVTPT